MSELNAWSVAERFVALEERMQQTEEAIAKVTGLLIVHDKALSKASEGLDALTSILEQLLELCKS